MASALDSKSAIGDISNRDSKLLGAERVTDSKRESATARNADSISYFFGQGEVLRSTPGAFDVLVNINGKHHVCQVLSGACARGSGVAITAMPSEGDVVLVFKPHQQSDTGLVLGVVPGNTGSMVRGDQPQPKSAWVSDMREAIPASDAMVQQVCSDTSIPMSPAASGRYRDQHQGEWSALVSGKKVGLKIAGACAAMLGGSRAKVLVSKIQDMVLFRSNLMRNIHAGGENRIYNDNGCVTSAFNMCTSTKDRLGGKAYDKVEPDLKRVQAGAVLTDSIRDKILDLKARPNIRAFCGYVGGLARAFLGKTEDDDNKTGVMDFHAGEDGRVTFKSKAGFSLQCTDRIPMPIDRYEPWDPQGADPSLVGDGNTPKSGDFNFRASDTKALELRSAEAWRSGVADSPMRGPLSKDFYFSEAADIGGDTKPAYFNMEADGSIIIRGGQGEEIIIADGAITLSAPKGIRVASGSSVEILGGDDVIVKAKNSVDVIATNNDVRIKAENNLQLGAVSDASSIVLDCRNKKLFSDASNNGEKFESAGILLRAPDSTVYSCGKKIHMSGESEVLIESEGSVSSLANIVTCSGASSVNLTSGGSAKAIRKKNSSYSWFKISSNAAYIYSPFLTLATKTGIAMTLATQVAGIDWNVPTSDNKKKAPNPYEEIFDDFLDTYSKPRDTMEDFFSSESKLRTAPKFSYRSSLEYAIINHARIALQPAWAYMLEHGEAIAGIKLGSWKENSLDDEYPWPGKTAYEASSYIKLKDEKNIVTKKLVTEPVLWQDLEPRSDDTVPVPFDQYPTATIV